MLKMQENAGIFGFPGLHLTHEGTLGGWRMLLVRPTGRNWATDRSGDWWWYTSNWGTLLQPPPSTECRGSAMFFRPHPVFTGASGKPLCCWQSKFICICSSFYGFTWSFFEGPHSRKSVYWTNCICCVTQEHWGGQILDKARIHTCLLVFVYVFVFVV